MTHEIGDLTENIEAVGAVFVVPSDVTPPPPPPPPPPLSLSLQLFLPPPRAVRQFVLETLSNVNRQKTSSRSDFSACVFVF